MKSHVDFLNACDAVLSAAARRGLLYRTVENAACDGRTLVLDGRELLQFGSGSYMGLETDERLKEGAIEAIRRFGTQFPSSRAYLSAPLYENLLSAVFGLPTLVTASTTLAHQAAVPVIVEDRDAVIFDQQVHATVQAVLDRVRVHGVHVEMLRHNRMDVLEARVDALRREYRRVWYMADGVYSMYGDRAPMGDMMRLLDRFEALHPYLDDAHGMSWTGTHGRGHVLEALPSHPRQIVATSLAKSFSSGGGALLVPDADTRRGIRMLGPSLVFSGPLQPSNLGAAIASARLHLSPEIVSRQEALCERLLHVNRRCRELGLPLLSDALVPIRFVGLGPPAASIALVERLLADGFYCNAAVFPAVPMQRAGVRFTVTLHQHMADLDAFLEAMARHLPEVLADEGLDLAWVRETFGLAPVAPPEQAARHTEGLTARVAASSGALKLRHERSIVAFEPACWDAWFGGRGAFEWEALRGLEEAFSGQSRPEDNWAFHYYEVRDAEGTPVLATFFTEALWKEDMLAPEGVSQEVEAIRVTEPGYLVARYLAMGTLLTEGEHLWMDRTRDWRAALALVLQAARDEQAACGATHLVVRDVPAGDTQLDAWLTEQGFARFPMPESLVQTLDWQDLPAYLASLSQKSRRHVRREVLPWEDAYEVEVLGAAGRWPDEDEFRSLHDLYLQVKRRNLRVNTFSLPSDFLAGMLASPAWEILALRLRESPSRPVVGFVLLYHGHGHAVPLLVGMDDRHVGSQGLYRQLLWQAVQRARARGAHTVHHGLGTALEKSRLGARVRAMNVYLQSSDTYAAELLAQLGLDAVRRTGHAP